MPDPSVPYEFPAPLFIWHWPRDPVADPPDADASANWRAFTDPRNFGFGGYTSGSREFVELLVPYGTPIYDGRIASTLAGDRVSSTSPGTTWYTVLWVEVIYRGFPRQCYKVVAKRDHVENHDAPAE